jgi:hypothetical protein
MGTLIQAGQLLVAGTQPGDLNQYYGFADANSTTVTAASFANLSSQYNIPAGEADTADVAYELACGGSGTWGSTQQALTFQPVLGSGFGSGGVAAAAALAASAGFTWGAVLTAVCSDGVSGWWATLKIWLQETANAVNPGTAADNAFPLVVSNTSVHSAATNANIAVAVQCKWASATGTPTITNNWTTFRKIS